MKMFSLVLPCYNEGDNINSLLNSVTKIKKNEKDLEIIIVENGSTDNSLVKIKDHESYTNNLITLVEIEKNLGYGHGIMTGLHKTTGEYIGWCHGDLQNNLDDINNIFKQNYNELEKNNVIIKGKRKNRSFIDNFFTACMSFVVSFLFQCKLSDINAPPKIFPRNFLDILVKAPNDFSLDLYFLLTAKHNNYHIIEHPLIIYKRTAGEAKGGGTLFTKIRLTLRTLNYIYKLKTNRKF
jgi:glycosyltransferase involved in cell wall biosynthesis